jgi:hypothetical protein
MENGSPGLLWENNGGSTRLNGEPVLRRLERRPIRLCLGEPRLRLIGVELVVLGRCDESAFRTEGIEGEVFTDGTDLDEGDVKMENWTGFEYASPVFDFLVGELKMDGSMFSASSSSNSNAARRLLPEDWAGLPCGDEKVDEIAIGIEFSDWTPETHWANAYHSACSSNSGESGDAGCRVRQRAGA